MTTLLGRWETIVQSLKFENNWGIVLEKYLKDNNLEELPEPEWTDDPTMAYIYLPAKSLDGKTVRLDKTKARMFPESIVGYLEKGGLMKLPAKVEASQRSQKKEQLPKMETEKPKPEKNKGELL
jgi:hypothetical protein|tara:strand:+ start:13124 stop:13495 length:372 start_codon:yes stop_codon:yes gene_type:complete